MAFVLSIVKCPVELVICAPGMEMDFTPVKSCFLFVFAVQDQVICWDIESGVALYLPGYSHCG